jgi:hypothetical protein
LNIGAIKEQLDQRGGRDSSAAIEIVNALCSSYVPGVKIKGYKPINIIGAGISARSGVFAALQQIRSATLSGATLLGSDAF